MIRQARSYLAGAVSATALVSLAVVAFVVLVSLQALRDWPRAGLATGAEKGTAVSNARPASGNATQSVAAGAGSATAKATAPSAGGGAGPQEEAGAEEAHATIPVADQPSGGSEGSQAQSPGGSAQPSVSSTPSGAGQQTPPSVPPSVGSTVEDTVSGAGQVVNETVTGAGQAVEGVVGGAGDSSSPIGRATSQVTEVTDALLGGNR
jgi:hypothetical protein